MKEHIGNRAICALHYPEVIEKEEKCSFVLATKTFNALARARCSEEVCRNSLYSP